MKYVLLKENIHKARKVLKSKELDENNESFIKIKEMLVNHSGFLGLFTFLFFKRKTSLVQLSELLSTLIKNKQLLKYLPKQVVNYEKLEELYDDLNIAKEWVIYNKEFVSRLTSPLKKMAKEDSVLKDAYVHLSNDDKKDLLINFVKKVARYKQDYIKFKNDCLYYISKNDQILLDVVDEINNTPGAYLIYNNNNIIIAEIYTKKASCDLGSKSWCISDGSSEWETYMALGKGNKQYFIWNFNIPSYDIESRVGSTINSGGSEKTSHLKNDDRVFIKSYLNKYDIPNILTPLNLENDIDKLVDSHELDGTLIDLIYKSGRINDFLDKIPKSYKYVYGLLSEEETNKLKDFKKYIYSNKKHAEGESLFLFCNKFIANENNIEDFLEEHKNSKYMTIINTLDFRDKIMLLNKYQYINNKATSWQTDENRNMGNRLSSYTIEVLFQHELNVQEIAEHDLEISVGDHTGDITFEFEYDKDDYVVDILNIDNDEHYALETLDGGYGGYGILDTGNKDELNYIPHRFTDSLTKKLIEYFNFLLEYTTHPDLIDKLKNIIKDAEDGYSDYGNQFVMLMDIISTYIDPLFCEYSAYQQYSYFDDFWESAMSSAQSKVDEDSLEYEKHKKGTFEEDRNNNSGTWEIDLGDIVDVFKSNTGGFNLDEPYSITDWLNEHPSDLSNMDVHYDDYPYSSTYIAAADYTDACDKLEKELDDVINGLHSDFEIENIENLKIYTNYLNKTYTPFSVGSEYNYIDWLGYKKRNGAYMLIIPLSKVGNDGNVKVYNVPMNIIDNTNKKESDTDYFDIRILDKNNNEKDLEKKGIEINNTWIDVPAEEMEIRDPNQLQFKFEKLKTFIDFNKTK